MFEVAFPLYNEKQKGLHFLNFIISWVALLILTQFQHDYSSKLFLLIQKVFSIYLLGISLIIVIIVNSMHLKFSAMSVRLEGKYFSSRYLRQNFSVLFRQKRAL